MDWGILGIVRLIVGALAIENYQFLHRYCTYSRIIFDEGKIPYRDILGLDKLATGRGGG